jgi:tetratricopeptide (TPR) repeat protein
VKKALILLLILGVGYVIVLPLWRNWRFNSLQRDGIEAYRDSRWSDAARLFENAAQYAGDTEQAWVNLGLARSRMGDLEGAEVAFKKAISINFNDPRAILALANLQLRLGDYAGAEDLARASIGLRPDNADTYYILGCVYAQTKRLTNAVEAYQQSIHYQPENGPARYDLGWCYANLGKYEDARKELDESVRLTPSDPASHLLLGRVLVTLGDMPGADQQQRLLRDLDKRAATDLLELIKRTAARSVKQSTNELSSVELNLHSLSDRGTEGGP